MNRLYEIKNLALSNVQTVTRSPGDWMRFLDSAARMYKYPFPDQLLIFAQMPEATACASLDVWNKKMNRWVNRGAKGIALIDDTVTPQKLKYVFDISSTHAVRQADEPYIWKMNPGHEAAVLSHIAESYGIDSVSLTDALRKIAAQMTDENLGEFLDISDTEMSGSRFGTFPYDERAEIFRQVLESSITYTLARRCGLDAERIVPEASFSAIGNFNRMAILSVIGNACARLSEAVLTDIGREVRKFDKENSAHLLEKRVRPLYNDFSALQRESLTTHDNDNGKSQGGIDYGTEVLPQRGLPVPESGARTRSDGAHREVRTDEESVPEGAQAGLVSEHAPDGQAGQASVGDRQGGAEPRGADRESAADDESRTQQGDGSDGMGSTHEHSDSAGRGTRDERPDLLLTEDNNPDTEAETETVSALSLPDAPSAEEQIEEIRHRVLSPLTADTNIPAEVIDDFLRSGSGRRQSIPRILYYMSLDIPEKQRTELIRKEYREGSKGIIVDGRRYTMSYDENGIHFSFGNTAYNNPGATVLNWDEITARFSQLLEAGQFTQQGVLDTYTDEILNEYAQTLWYMKRDMEENAAHVFDGLDMSGGGFESDIAKITDILKAPEYRDELIARLDVAAEVYKSDRSIMRFHLYKPDQVADLFHRLQLPRRTYTAETGFIPDSPRTFITQDSVDQVLKSGGPYSESRLSIYSFFCMHKDTHDRIEYLKDFFGMGGRSPALRGNDDISEEYDSKGIRLSLGSMTRPDDSVLMSWLVVATRIQMLMNSDRYLTAQDREKMPEFEREQIAGRIVSFYDNLPEGFTSVFKDADRSERVKKAIGILQDDGATEELIANMMDVLAATPADDKRYEFRAKVYADTFDYAEDAYTIFPEEQPVEQMSMETLFDYIEQPANTPAEKAETEPETNEAKSDAPEKELAPGMRFEVDGRSFEIESIKGLSRNVALTDVTFRENTGFPVMRIESYDTVLNWLHRQQERERAEEQSVLPAQEPINYKIYPGEPVHWNARESCGKNIDAIRLLKQIESENRMAAPEEQIVLSGYAGWGGIPQAFDSENAAWAEEYRTLKELLTPEEYEAARSTTLNAFYTDPSIAQAICAKLEQMGMKGGNLLEPSCGTGNFMGVIPESFENTNVFGVELDSISGRIAKQLYQKNNITIGGFEKTALPESFFDCVVGNVPFGNYGVADKKYDRFHFLIHDYFIAKSLDLVRPGGVVAVITTSGTLDKQNEVTRRYIAERADLLGAVRLPNNAFSENANTEVVTDILFLQKRDSRAVEIPEWVDTAENEDGITMNKYFLAHPEMVLGRTIMKHGRFGDEMTVEPYAGTDLSEQLKTALGSFDGNIVPQEITDTDLTEPDLSIPADPAVRNFSYANINGKVYYRENSRMVPAALPQTTAERVLAMINMRDTTRLLLDAQLEDDSDERIAALQNRLSEQYDAFTAKYGLISSTANRRAFSQDSSYCLLSSLEILDEDGNFKRKADIFTKRTIRKAEPVHSVETASEALAVSIGERAKVDLPFMSELCGKDETEIIAELYGVIFKDPETGEWLSGDEYLSGNVREKLITAQDAAQGDPDYEVNVRYLTQVQPKYLEASDIEVRLGATWIEPEYINRFMREIFHTPYYRIGSTIKANYAEVSGAWYIDGKNSDRYNPTVDSTYGTSRVNGYKLLEDALNLKDTKIYDLIDTADGQQRVLNKKETMLAQQKQDMIRAAFKDWIFRDVTRREQLVQKYNELFNSTRPREYDGSHIRFVGMTPEITLMPHQKNAVAHILYGKNTLLAHCVGAGKTFEMIAAGMESKRLGLSRKNLYVVPNHLTEQWGADFLRLYPGANILVATKKDFEPANRKRFCSRIATGDYDAVIIGHSQFEKIPLSKERQAASIQAQINEVTAELENLGHRRGESFSIKQLERTRKSLQVKLERLNDQSRKDDVVTFEQLGVDRLFVDESHSYKNLYLYTKMQNVAGIQQTDAQKSSDMFMKCRYMDELTGGRGVTFATGTPISNSMVELYSIMRYLQYDTLEKMGLRHFDSWASAFGDTVTAIELAPEGTGYRAKTRFARFFNLPELISVFKESADVQTPDMLNLPVPKAHFINMVLKPSEEQKQLVTTFSDRAEKVRGGAVDPTEDNMLKITNDGRKCALDQRLVNTELPDADVSKVNACVQNAFHVWQDGIGAKTTQLIFCDLSTPKADGSFNVYTDVKNKLIAQGIPPEEIAFIHDADTETKKAELFAKVRAGQVRILLGSTPKLGAGTNVQDRLVALHHLDAPWKPSDLEQQEGRILRQGNMNPEVQIFRYVTEGTFDAYMWQLLENKQKFISQIMTSKSPVRSCEDVDDTALSYAEIKALATGNPYIKEKMDLDVQVSKLRMLKASHVSQIYRLESDIARNYPGQIAAVTQRIANLTADNTAAQPLLEQAKDNFAMTVSGKTYTERKEAGAALIKACTATKELRHSIPIGVYGPFKLTADYNPFTNLFEVSLGNHGTYTIEVGVDPAGNITRINNALENLPKHLEESMRKLETLEDQLENAREEVKRPFPQEKELAEKSARLSELNTLLNMDERTNEAAMLEDGTPETGAEEQEEPAVKKKREEVL